MALIDNISFGISADTSGFSSAVEKLNALLSKLQKVLGGMEEGLKKVGVVATRAGSGFSSLVKMASAFVAVGLVKQLKIVEQAFSSLSKSTEIFGRGWSGLKRVFGEFGASIKGIFGTVSKSSPAFEKLGVNLKDKIGEGVRKITPLFSRFSKTIGESGKKVDELSKNVSGKFDKSFNFMGKSVLNASENVKKGFGKIGHSLGEVVGLIEEVDLGLNHIAGKTFARVFYAAEGASAGLSGLAFAMSGLGPSGVVAAQALEGLSIAAHGVTTALGFAIKILGGFAKELGSFLIHLSSEFAGSAAKFQKALFSISVGFEQYLHAVKEADISLEDITKRTFELAKATGFSQEEIFRAVAVNLELARVTGLTADQMFRVIEVAANLAAFMGTDLTTAVYALDQAFRDVSQGIETQFGVNLSLATEEAQKLMTQLGKSKAELTLQEKSWIRYNVLMEQASGIMKAAANSAGVVLFRALQVLNAELKNLEVRLGEASVKTMTPLINAFASFVNAINELPPVILNALGAAIQFGGYALKLSGILLSVGGTILAFISGMQLLTLVIQRTNLGAIIAGLVGLQAASATASKFLVTLTRMGLKGAMEMVGALALRISKALIPALLTLSAKVALVVGGLAVLGLGVKMLVDEFRGGSKSIDEFGDKFKNLERENFKMTSSVDESGAAVVAWTRGIENAGGELEGNLIPNLVTAAKKANEVKSGITDFDKSLDNLAETIATKTIIWVTEFLSKIERLWEVVKKFLSEGKSPFAEIMKGEENKRAFMAVAKGLDISLSKLDETKKSFKDLSLVGKEAYDVLNETIKDSFELSEDEAMAFAETSKKLFENSVEERLKINEKFLKKNTELIREEYAKGEKLDKEVLKKLLIVQKQLLEERENLISRATKKETDDRKRAIDEAKKLERELTLSLADEFEKRRLQAKFEAEDRVSQIKELVKQGVISEQQASKLILQVREALLKEIQAIDEEEYKHRKEILEKLRELEAEEAKARFELRKKIQEIRIEFEPDESVKARLQLDKEYFEKKAELLVFYQELEKSLQEEALQDQFAIFKSSYLERVKFLKVILNALLNLEKQYSKEREKVERLSYIRRLKESGSFFDRLKGAFLEFAESFREGTEALDRFFADTLTRMSQAFSDFVYNVMRGKFDDLVDIAKAAFQAILKAFIDMITAMATREIIISISGRMTRDLTQSVAGASTLSQPGFPAPLGMGGALGNFGLGFTTNPFGVGGIFSGIQHSAQGTAFTLGQIALLGAPVIGAGLGFLTGGVPGALSGGLAGLGYLGGTVAGNIMGGTIGSIVPVIGTIVGGFLGSLLGSLFGSSKKKFEVSVEGAIRDVLKDKDLFDTKRVEDEVIDALQENLRSAITGIASAISFSPELVNELLEREISLKGGGKFKDPEKARKNIEAFITGGFIKPLIEQISDIFVSALGELGVPIDLAQSMVEDFEKQLEEIHEATKDWEDRTKRGELMMKALQEFLAQITSVQALLGERIPGEIDRAIISLKELADEIGFSGIPSLEMIREEFKKLMDSAEDIDISELISQFATLRSQIISLTIAIANSISEIQGFIMELNDALAQFGIVAVDTSDALLQSVYALQGIIEAGGLTPEEEFALLKQMKGLLDQFVNAQLQVQQKVIESQIRATEAQIDALERQRRQVEESARKRIDQLQEELRMVEQLEDLILDVERNIRELTISRESPLNVFQRMAVLRSTISDKFAELGTATGEDRIRIARELQDMLNELLSLGAEAFGLGTPEYVAIFNEVVSQLELLQGLLEPVRSSEEILAEIENIEKATNQKLESIDSRIEALNNQIQSLQQQSAVLQGAIAEEVAALYQYIRDHAVELLNQQLENLNELSGMGVTFEQQMVSVAESQLEELHQINQGIRNLTSILSSASGGGDSTGQMGGYLAGVQTAQYGFHGLVTRPTLFLAGESGAEMVSVTPMGGMEGGLAGAIINMDIDIDKIDSPERVKELRDEILRLIRFTTRRHRRLRWER